MDASRPGFMSGSLAPKQLQSLYDRLEEVRDEQAQQLLASFQTCCSAVWGGEKAFASELEAVEVKLLSPFCIAFVILYMQA